MRTPVITPALLSAVKAHLMAKAYTDVIRPIVLAYQSQILEKHKFPYIDGSEGYVTEVRYAYRISEEHADTLYCELDEAKKAYAFGKGLEAGECPLLAAEWQQIQACQLMIDEAAYITKIRYDDIVMMEHYGELEALIEKIVINHPKHKNEFQASKLLQTA